MEHPVLVVTADFAPDNSKDLLDKSQDFTNRHISKSSLQSRDREPAFELH
jgi:hypothetical protein